MGEGLFRLEALAGSRLAWIHFARNVDPRGWLSEIFNQSALNDFGLPSFPQDNISRTTSLGLIRGLHYQRPPHAQAKLFRVVRGRAYTVAVDLLPGADPRPIGVEMGEDTAAWLYLPPGFAHGLQTLEPVVDIHYKVSAPYTPSALGALAYDDPGLNIAWPLPCPKSFVSDRDRTAGDLAAGRSAFAQSD